MGEFHLRLLPGLLDVLQTGTIVVIGRGAPEVGTQLMTLIEELHAPYLVVRDEARSLIDLNTPVRALDDVVLHIVGEELGGGLGALLVELQLGQLTLLQDELLVC